MSLLDQLINEIVLLTGLSEDEVKENFTQEQLNILLESSKCEYPDVISPIFDNIEDISCKDDGSPSDIVKGLKLAGNFPDGLDEYSKLDADLEAALSETDDIFDGSECVDSMDEVNKKIKEQIDLYNDYNILLNRLYELQDHLKPLEYYYLEREKRLGIVLNDFQPVLAEIKRLKTVKELQIKEQKKVGDDLSKLKAKIYNRQQDLIDYNQELYDALTNYINQTQIQINTKQLILENKSAKYPALHNTNITGYRDGNVNKATFISSISKVISDKEISDLGRDLKRYSEYISLDINKGFKSFSEFSKSSRISFKIKFQNLNFMNIDRERVDQQTGKRSEYKEKFYIQTNILLQDKSFFASIPGYSLSNIDGKEYSTGQLYIDYYNKLNDPINELFTLSERGLTTNLSKVDPSLKDSDVKTKIEKDKEYYIKDLNIMQNFYQEFDSLFETKKRVVRKATVESGTSSISNKLSKLARMDVELLAAAAGVNLYLPEDDEKLRTAINNISNATKQFIDVLNNLASEISRIETEIENNKPTPDKVKDMLRAENSKCFGDIPDDDTDDGCADVHAMRGSDPFFKSIDGIDPTLPNFSQSCYWKEFSKLATLQGLFPIPNNPTTLRYWPVGLIIPTPGPLIKIPLPMIWLPLVTISTPLGVLVFFLNINGIFITPMVFFLSASGFKQFMLTTRGSSPKFGSDRNDELIKPTIQIPLMVASAKDMAKFGGSINPDDYLSEKDKIRLQSIKDKMLDAKSSGDKIRLKKAEAEIDGIKQKVLDKVTPASKKMMDIANKGEDIIDMIKETKENIFKVMDDLGKPSFFSINSLKERIEERKHVLKQRKLKALEEGNSKEVRILNEHLKMDGLSINEKSEAFKQDLLTYFDSIIYTKKVFPRESDKIDPKPNGNADPLNKAKELSSKLSKDFISDESIKLQKIVALNIAKHKNSLENVIDSTSNIDTNISKVIGDMIKVVEELGNKILSKGSKALDPSSLNNQLKSAKDSVDNAINSDAKKKAEQKYKKVQESLSSKLELDRNKLMLSMTPGLIASLAAVSIKFDPFAPCCNKSEFATSFSIPIGIALVVDQGLELIKDKISGMSASELKSLFGGKTIVTPRDMRLGLLSLSRSVIPESLSIPKPSVDLNSATRMFSGLLKSISQSQASFPSVMSSLQLDKKIEIDLKILKPVFKKLLDEYLDTNLISKIPQSLETDFMNINPNDMKSFLKTFINAQDDAIRDKVEPFFNKLKLLKSANGIDLNILENKTFSIMPFGPAAKILFTTKGLAKMYLSKALSQFVIDKDVVDIASSIMEKALTPIVSNPLAYIAVAAAGVTNNLDTIRKIHPILSADDIPPWERLTMKNILLLVFLDEFISNAADKTGFFRSFL